MASPRDAFTFLNWTDELARKRARRGSRRDIYGKREEPGKQNRRGLQAGLISDGERRDEHEWRAFHHNAWRGVASPHRAIISYGVALRIAVALVLL